jgi:cysteine peptidase B
VFVLLLVAGVFAIDLSMTSMLKEWKEFKKVYDRSYETKADELYRFGVFVKNMETSKKLNEAPGNKATYGMTKFSDLTPEEFKATYLTYRPSNVTRDTTNTIASTGATATPPCSINWTTKGATTPIYNQGQCGSCWAFSATEQIETMFYLGGAGALTKFSMQQIVSCDTTCDGCNGGEPYLAYKYIMNAGGIETYSDYPYSSGNGITGSCKFNKADIYAKVNSWKYISQSASGEATMASTVCSTSPLSICVDASTWQNYRGGIVTSNCGTQLDHCVQAVGLVQSGSPPYWIVRNQWGVTWGEQGYIYLEYGVDMCGLALESTTVSASKA